MIFSVYRFTSPLLGPCVALWWKSSNLLVALIYFRLTSLQIVLRVFPLLRASTVYSKRSFRQLVVSDLIVIQVYKFEDR